MNSQASANQLSAATMRRFALFASVPEEVLSLALSSARLLKYQNGDTVVGKGRDFDVLCFLTAGKLQVVDVLPDGTEFGLNLIEPGQFFGELSVIDGRPRSATVTALTSSTVVQLPGDAARRLIYGNAQVAESMMTHLASTVRRMTDLRALQAIPQAPQRVYALLAYLKRTGANGVHVIDQAPTHTKMAIMVNTSRETVTRALALLKAEGIIQKDLRRLIIRRPDELRRLIELHRP
jgi:CRP-like cAMP-binding protein